MSSTNRWNAHLNFPCSSSPALVVIGDLDPFDAFPGNVPHGDDDSSAERDHGKTCVHCNALCSVWRIFRGAATDTQGSLRSENGVVQGYKLCKLWRGDLCSESASTHWVKNFCNFFSKNSGWRKSQKAIKEHRPISCQ